MRRPIVVLRLLVVLAAGALLAGPASAQGDRQQGRDLPPGKAELRLDAPVHLDVDPPTVSKVHPMLWRAKGQRQVIVLLKTPAVAAVKDRLARGQRKLQIDDEQRGFTARCHQLAPSARILARTQLVLNAVFLEIDGREIRALARDPDVVRIAPVGNYEMDLSETVPQIGADKVQAAGIDGSGVRVAVLDSGVDYTHARLGGAGTLAAYEAAYGTDTGPMGTDDAHRVLDGQFPSAKVVGGFDFVGEDWPFGPLNPDPDPIPARDLTSPGGHGTHVAHIIGGSNGVAPGVELYAVKVCASYSTSCSGVALIQGMEFAVDPDGDGDPDDRVDIINMSLGANYGQPFDDDLSTAVDNATALGVFTVASAGNGSDVPYIAGSPAAAATAISVAQTEVASVNNVQAMRVDLPPPAAGNYVAIFQPWSAPLTGVISGPVQYGDGGGGNLNGCAPFAPGSLAGKIVFVDRGVCNFTRKAINIQGAGGILGIIGLVAPGDPFPGGAGDPDPILIPTYMISQADGNILRAGTAEVTFDPANKILFNALVRSTSSRGPSYEDSGVKPEIAAPGASVSAASGTGTGENAFGGTSGAAPMVSGTAALILDARRGDDARRQDHGDDGEGRGLSPLELKALLMNTADDVVNNSISQGLAPISRIGSGEVRADRAVTSAAAAWDAESPSGGLSFGFVDVALERVELSRRIRVRNYSEESIRFEITPTFRFADDEANGAVHLSVSPQSLSVPGGANGTVWVTLTIDGNKLRNNLMNSGSLGGNPAPLTTNEYDGYLRFEPVGDHDFDGGEDGEGDDEGDDEGDGDDDGDDEGDEGDEERLAAIPIHMPWHVLPRKAARLRAERHVLDFEDGPVDTIGLHNRGVGTAQNDGYSLLAFSPDIPEGGRGEQSPTPDIRAFGVQTFDGSSIPGCGVYVMAFAFNLWERQTMAQFPGQANVLLDTDQDGSPDYQIANFQLNSFVGFAGDRRNVSVVFDLNLGGASFFFFTEQATNTTNQVMYVCASQIGDEPLFDLMDAAVFVDDVYFGGPGDILVSTVTLAPLGERYFALLTDLSQGASGTMDVIDFGPVGTNPNELGVMVFTNGDRGSASRGGATEETEVKFFTIPGVVVPEPLPEGEEERDD